MSTARKFVTIDESPHFGARPMLIENDARHKAAELVDRFAGGVITNFEFDDQWPEAAGRRDPALRAIGSMLWNFYSETESHKLEGRYAPNNALRGLLSRCAAFLRTSLPYEWPHVNFSPPGGLAEFIEDVLHQGTLATHTLASHAAAASDREDRAAWPFRRRSDYEAIVRR